MESLGRHTDYGQAGLLESDLAADPFDQFRLWLSQAEQNEIFEPNAMVLSTQDPAGQLSSRTVLLKGFGEGTFQFVTNYGSRKAAALAEHPSVSLLFPWYSLKRQVIVYGQATQASAATSDALWNVRPRGAQLASMASSQSQPIGSRDEMDAALALLEALHPGEDPIPRPANWGAFEVTPNAIEFWQGRSMRFHDRLRYELGSEGAAGGWHIIRLQP